LWFVEAGWHGIDWPMRDALTKRVRGSVGSGMDMTSKRYDITWTAKTEKRARAIASKIGEAVYGENDLRVRHGVPVTHVRLNVYRGD
jgi:hypothetical protein